MILKSLHLENFKGAKDKIYKFGKTTRVSGMNRLGKTTIATAWFWLLADKNYELVSNPNIRPDDVEECVPTVTAVLDVDGKEIAIAKMQKRKVGKPDANGISKVTITNTYEINSVPKTERDFRADLEELGLSFDNFLVCSHPDVFTRQKQADMRKVCGKSYVRHLANEGEIANEICDTLCQTVYDLRVKYISESKGGDGDET